MSGGSGKRRRVLSYDERVLWTAVTESVAPLNVRKAKNSDEQDLPETGSPSDLGTKSGGRPQVSKSVKSPAVRTLTPKAPVKTAALPEQNLQMTRRMKQRLVRGKETIDGRIDLHGFTQADAHAALLRFLRSANARGARLVLVITGKGTKSLRFEGERGVLRRQVPQWLGQPELRQLVIGFQEAHVAHGGEGALYVRLRRKAED
jgi:DNA-nicking Smr family endonuclease